jgi:hypothetical protein
VTGPTGITGPTGATGSFALPQNTVTITSNYTVATSDAGKLLIFNSASALTVTVPYATFDVASTIDVITINTGDITFVATDSGVNLNGTPGLTLRAQYSAASLVQYSSYNWLLAGDLRE